MPHPQVAARHDRTIRIDYPRLFMGSDKGSLEEFLIRAFEEKEVVSVAVDRAIGSAVVNLNPRCQVVLVVLSRLADAYAQPRPPVLAPSHCPYFVLQEDGANIIFSRAPQPVSGLRRWLYRGLSTVFFGVSIVGVWAPLVPTTPFVILSSYFALRASPELNERLLRSRLFGRILKDWYSRRAMRRSTKRRVLIFMVAVFTLTFGLMRPSPASLPLALLITLVSFGFVLSIPTVEDEQILPQPAMAAQLLPARVQQG
ncbi:MAG: ybaN [Proteobacteria bacterium]|nr:ybaN [Pseudomonadota bacterium]